MQRSKLSLISTSALLALLAVISGCDDESSNAGPATRPTAVVASSQPTNDTAVLASYTGRAPSSLNLDGRDELFPAAKLAVLGHGSGGFNLRLCSDDPPAAIDPGYIGNSFVIDMRLPIDRIEDIANASWDFNSSDSDDASGIFLHGSKDQYRPSDLHVTFQKNGDQVLAFLTGALLHIDSLNPAAPPQHVQLNACLRATLQTR